MVNIQSTLTKN